MRTALISPALPLLLALSLSANAATIEFTANGVGARAWGHTTYELNAAYYENEELRYVRSELEFPLDVYLVGAAFGLLGRRNGGPRWALDGGLYASMTNPNSPMKDHDWLKKPNSDYTKFSYTESSVEMSATIMQVEGSFWLLRWGRFNFGLLAGYRYQLIKQDLIGYEGWQIRDDGTRVEVSGSERGIFYKISYNLPLAGIRTLCDWNETARLDIRAAYVRVIASDFDDHVLRNKIGVADMTGNGVNLRVGFRYNLSRSKPQVPFIDISSDFLYLKANGGQTQSWYGDDPASDEDDTGSVIDGIPHDLESLQVQLGIRVGLSF